MRRIQCLRNGFGGVGGVRVHVTRRVYYYVASQMHADNDDFTDNSTETNLYWISVKFWDTVDYVLE